MFAPLDLHEPVIVAGKRYLFKRSRRAFADQFWSEIVAYRVGCLLGVEVPPAFVAWNSVTAISGALIEWFYIDSEEVTVLGGDFLQRLEPSFDREKGSTHNLRQNEIILRALGRLESRGAFASSWRQWWADALLFDALIGNTDRHQDNWGVLFRRREKNAPPALRMTPLFDNGTSLGHELFPEKFRLWGDEHFNRYIGRGKHHVGWDSSQPPIRGHFTLLEQLLLAWPDTRVVLAGKLKRVDEVTLLDALSDLMYLCPPVALSQDRFDFAVALMMRRLAHLRALLE